MTPQQFISNWQRSQLRERASCQSHFHDLCALLGQPKPTDVDSDGAFFTFEKGVRTSDDGRAIAP